ncbi:MAG: WYL domain-containing protein [Chloroflexota bacterium]|nr:MAG: WYL domain-containing protein [Chloroflexota bacterium]
MKALLQTPIQQAAVVVLDTETTGLFPSMGHRIVEIGAVRFQPGPAGRWQKAAEFNQLLQPDRRMEPGATRVNGITDADLIGMPRFGEIADQLLELLDDALLVAHNARFDAEFLGMELHLAQKSASGERARTLPNPWLCTLLLARHHFYFGGNSLGHIARVLGVRAGRAHRALNDVYVTAEVLKRMLRELAQINLVTVADLLEAQGGPLYTPAPAGVDLPAPFDLALGSRQPVRIVYAGPSGTSERVIEPLYSTSKAGVTYLIAHCRLRRDQRTFRLDRIVSAEIEGR